MSGIWKGLDCASVTFGKVAHRGQNRQHSQVQSRQQGNDTRRCIAGHPCEHAAAQAHPLHCHVQSALPERELLLTSWQFYNAGTLYIEEHVIHVAAHTIKGPGN